MAGRIRSRAQRRPRHPRVLDVTALIALGSVISATAAIFWPDGDAPRITHGTGDPRRAHQQPAEAPQRWRARRDPPRGESSGNRVLVRPPGPRGKDAAFGPRSESSEAERLRASRSADGAWHRNRIRSLVRLQPTPLLHRRA